MLSNSGFSKATQQIKSMNNFADTIVHSRDVFRDDMIAIGISKLHTLMEELPHGITALGLNFYRIGGYNYFS